ncbi:hypothetical protein PInf_013781 [Phytophthora infestans]|nr:hypothetical protein PInf_013781 [Phytophthora infestans]
MSPTKRTSTSPGKAPSTTPPASPSMSPTDVRTLTAELQTAQNARDQAQRAETAVQQAYQSLSTSSYATQDPRRLLADQTVEIRNLAGRLDRASRQRDGMRDDNEYLLREMALAGSEIHQLQSRIHDLERDLEDSQAASAAADESLDRLRDELRLTQEEVVTNVMWDPPMADPH